MAALAVHSLTMDPMGKCKLCLLLWYGPGENKLYFNDQLIVL